MADQFQYVKLPDGSYGKFAANAGDDVIRGAIEKDFPDAFNSKPSTPVPAGLQGPPDPEYKPFLSAGNILDEGSGVLKSGAGTLSLIGHGADKLGILDNNQKQGLQDLDNYKTSANKGELFGKVLGTTAQALPAIYGGGEFAGGVADEVVPGLALPALGRQIAGSVAPILASGAKKVATGAGLAAGYELAHKLRELF